VGVGERKRRRKKKKKGNRKNKEGWSIEKNELSISYKL
jgi:hypothetical protein